MKSSHKHWYKEYLSCPDCGSAFIHSEDEIRCTDCDYQCAVAEPIEIKPKNPLPFSMTFSRKIDSPPDASLEIFDLTCPEIGYDGPTAIRDSSVLMSEMSRYLDGKSKVLDLGCGPRDQAAPVEYLGHQYVGIDYTSDNADLLADAHAIPFQNETFDCVLSYAVLEHLHNPFIAVSEIERVLKPGGVYIGTVSQGEPFHDSFFHHTSWGIISLISSVKTFRIERIWAAQDTLASLSRMGKYPRVIKLLLGLIDKLHRNVPQLAPRKMKWSLQEKQTDQLHSAGSICFVIKKQ